MEIDIERLRRDLIDYYGSGMVCGFGMLVVNISDIERASNQTIINIAMRLGLNLENYRIGYGRRR